MCRATDGVCAGNEGALPITWVLSLITVFLVVAVTSAFRIAVVSAGVIGVVAISVILGAALVPTHKYELILMPLIVKMHQPSLGHGSERRVREHGNEHVRGLLLLLVGTKRSERSLHVRFVGRERRGCGGGGDVDAIDADAHVLFVLVGLEDEDMGGDGGVGETSGGKEKKTC